VSLTAWHDDILVATLNRPERRNAVNRAALDQLLAAVEEAKQARVLVLTGAGGWFCAGADLTGVEDEGFASTLGAVLRGLGLLSVPVVAAIDGGALGAGMQLVLASDLRVATPTARFGIPAAKLGLAIDWWTIRRLTSEAGAAVARSMLMAASSYTGAELHGSGFVHRLGTLDDAMTWARELAALAPLSIAAHKRGIEVLESHAADPRFEAAQLAAWQSTDAHEGRTAFLEKRPPRFTGH
jgi:enoyl-CoA hydratase